MSNTLNVLEVCCVHVWQRVDGDPHARAAICAKIKALGGKIAPRLSKEVTHIIFQRKFQATKEEKAVEDADLREIYSRIAKAETPIRVVSPAWLHFSELEGSRVKEVKYLERRPPDPVFFESCPPKQGVKRHRVSGPIRPRELVETADVDDAIFSSSQQIRELVLPGAKASTASFSLLDRVGQLDAPSAPSAPSASGRVVQQQKQRKNKSPVVTGRSGVPAARGADGAPSTAPTNPPQPNGGQRTYRQISLTFDPIAKKPQQQGTPSLNAAAPAGLAQAPAPASNTHEPPPPNGAKQAKPVATSGGSKAAARPRRTASASVLQTAQDSKAAPPPALAQPRPLPFAKLPPLLPASATAAQHQAVNKEPPMGMPAVQGPCVPGTERGMEPLAGPRPPGEIAHPQGRSAGPPASGVERTGETPLAAEPCEPQAPKTGAADGQAGARKSLFGTPLHFTLPQMALGTPAGTPQGLTPVSIVMPRLKSQGGANPPRSGVSTPLAEAGDAAAQPTPKPVAPTEAEAAAVVPASPKATPAGVPAPRTSVRRTTRKRGALPPTPPPTLPNDSQLALAPTAGFGKPPATPTLQATFPAAGQPQPMDPAINPVPEQATPGAPAAEPRTCRRSQRKGTKPVPMPLQLSPVAASQTTITACTGVTAPQGPASSTPLPANAAISGPPAAQAPAGSAEASGADPGAQQVSAHPVTRRSSRLAGRTPLALTPSACPSPGVGLFLDQPGHAVPEAEQAPAGDVPSLVAFWEGFKPFGAPAPGSARLAAESPAKRQRREPASAAGHTATKGWFEMDQGVGGGDAPTPTVSRHCMRMQGEVEGALTAATSQTLHEQRVPNPFSSFDKAPMLLPCPAPNTRARTRGATATPSASRPPLPPSAVPGAVAQLPEAGAAPSGLRLTPCFAPSNVPLQSLPPVIAVSGKPMEDQAAGGGLPAEQPQQQESKCRVPETPHCQPGSSGRALPEPEEGVAPMELSYTPRTGSRYNTRQQHRQANAGVRDASHFHASPPKVAEPAAQQQHEHHVDAVFAGAASALPGSTRKRGAADAGRDEAGENACGVVGSEAGLVGRTCSQQAAAASQGCVRGGGRDEAAPASSLVASLGEAAEPSRRPGSVTRSRRRALESELDSAASLPLDSTTAAKGPRDSSTTTRDAAAPLSTPAGRKPRPTPAALDAPSPAGSLRALRSREKAKAPGGGGGGGEFAGAAGLVAAPQRSLETVPEEDYVGPSCGALSKGDDDAVSFTPMPMKHVHTRHEKENAACGAAAAAAARGLADSAATGPSSRRGAGASARKHDTSAARPRSAARGRTMTVVASQAAAAEGKTMVAASMAPPLPVPDGLVAPSVPKAEEPQASFCGPARSETTARALTDALAAAAREPKAGSKAGAMPLPPSGRPRVPLKQTRLMLLKRPAETATVSNVTGTASQSCMPARQAEGISTATTSGAALGAGLHALAQAEAGAQNSLLAGATGDMDVDAIESPSPNAKRRKLAAAPGTGFREVGGGCGFQSKPATGAGTGADALSALELQHGTFQIPSGSLTLGVPTISSAPAAKPSRAGAGASRGGASAPKPKRATPNPSTSRRSAQPQTSAASLRGGSGLKASLGIRAYLTGSMVDGRSVASVASAATTTTAQAPSLGTYPRGRENPLRAGVRYLAHTCVDGAMAADIHTAVQKLSGARLCTPGYEDGHVTHLVLGDPPRRTLKVLLAIANGALFVTPAWVTDSLAAGSWLPEEQYMASVDYTATSDAVRRQLQAQQQQRREGEQAGLTAESAQRPPQVAAPRSPRAQVAAKPLAGRLATVHNTQCNGLRLAEVQARKADLEKVIVALGGRVVPMRSANLLVILGGTNGTGSTSERRPRVAAANGAPMQTADEEWLLRLAERHIWEEPAAPA